MRGYWDIVECSRKHVPAIQGWPWARHGSGGAVVVPTPSRAVPPAGRRCVPHWCSSWQRACSIAAVSLFPELALPRESYRLNWHGKSLLFLLCCVGKGRRKSCHKPVCISVVFAQGRAVLRRPRPADSGEQPSWTRVVTLHSPVLPAPAVSWTGARVCNKQALIHPQNGVWVLVIRTGAGRNGRTRCPSVAWLWGRPVSNAHAVNAALGAGMFSVSLEILLGAVDLKEKGKLFEIRALRSEVLLWLNLQFGELGESGTGCWLAAQKQVPVHHPEWPQLIFFFSLSQSRGICKDVSKLTDDLGNSIVIPFRRDSSSSHLSWDSYFCFGGFFWSICFMLLPHDLASMVPAILRYYYLLNHPWGPCSEKVVSSKEGKRFPTSADTEVLVLFWCRDWHVLPFGCASICDTILSSYRAIKTQESQKRIQSTEHYNFFSSSVSLYLSPQKLKAM